MGTAVEKILSSIGLRAEESPSREGWARLLALLDERLAGDEAFWAAMDASESANRLKSEFLGVMSHELRTPLNGILGMAQLLRDTELDEERRDWVETILTSGESLLTIVNAILDFSKLEAGNLALVDGMTAPAALAYDTMQLFAATAHQKSIRLACVIEPGVPDVVGGDDRRVRQVLANLVGNAIKFTDQGHVILRVRTLTSGEAPLLRFDIEDTGIGIDPGVQSRIFESFVQGDASETRRHGGTGLGLAIAKRLAKLMRGDIGFTSMVGAGTTFSFEMPLRSYDDDAPAALTPRRPLRVLVLERIPPIADAHRSGLERMGYTVRVTGSVNEARGVIERDGAPFDVLFVDGSADLERAIESCEALAAIPSAPPAFLLAPSGNAAAVSRTDRARIAVVAHAPFRPEHAPRVDEAADGVRSPVSRMANSRPPPPAGTPRRRALVVEDNAINQRVAVRTLERLGLEAESVGNGRDALERLRHEHFDVVFMDCQMPLLNGYDATRRLRREEPADRHVPVIAMTAQSMPGDREKCIDAGMDDYVAKPLRMGEIEQKVARWVTNR